MDKVELRVDTCVFKSLPSFFARCVSGTEGLAEGTIGWPKYPNHTPSTLTFTTSAQPGVWFTPRWNEVWFPDAFAGPMADLMNAIATASEPECNGADNLKTMALVEAGYQSLRERRLVPCEA